MIIMVRTDAPTDRAELCKLVASQLAAIGIEAECKGWQKSRNFLKSCIRTLIPLAIARKLFVVPVTHYDSILDKLEPFDTNEPVLLEYVQDSEVELLTSLDTILSELNAIQVNVFTKSMTRPAAILLGESRVSQMPIVTQSQSYAAIAAEIAEAYSKRIKTHERTV